MDTQRLKKITKNVGKVALCAVAPPIGLPVIIKPEMYNKNLTPDSRPVEVERGK